MKTNPITLSSTPDAIAKQGQKLYFIISYSKSMVMSINNVDPNSIWITIQDAEKELERLKKLPEYSFSNFEILEIQLGCRKQIKWPSNEEIHTDEYKTLLAEREHEDHHRRYGAQHEEETIERDGISYVSLDTSRREIERRGTAFVNYVRGPGE